MSVPVGAAPSVHYAVSPAESWITFEARSTLHAVAGKATALSGYVDAAWTADDAISEEAAPKMHIEFPVEELRSGNGLQDREMWKVIDSKRFPRVAADLRTLQHASRPGSYVASGDITLAGRSRKYDGGIVVARSGDDITVDGDLRIDIRDFGLTPPNLLILKVDPLVKVRLHMVARRAA